MPFILYEDGTKALNTTKVTSFFIAESFREDPELSKKRSIGIWLWANCEGVEMMLSGPFANEAKAKEKMKSVIEKVQTTERAYIII